MLGEVLTAIVTPFRADGSVDLERFRALCRYLVENGSDGVVVTGTTGEAPTLTDDERFALFEAAVDELGGKHTVVAGSGTNDTAHSIHVTERAHEIGVDGFLVVTPYYNKPPQRGIVAHVDAVAAATDRPIVFYDIPARVVVDVEPATIEALARIDNVRAVKQAKPSLDAARTVVACGLDLYAGDDDLIFPFLEVGGVGGICVHTHVVGPQVKEMIRPLPQRRRGGRTFARRGAAARHRPPAGADQPDRDQVRAQPARARRGRTAPAPRRGVGGGDGRRTRLPRAPRPAAGRCCLSIRLPAVRPRAAGSAARRHARRQRGREPGRPTGRARTLRRDE